MHDSAAESDVVQVARDGAVVYIRVSGAGSFKVSPALKQFGSAVIDQGADRIVVDMASCTSMDSTFMGVLAGMALRLLRQGKSRIALCSLRPLVASRLRALGLERVMDVAETAAHEKAPAAFPLEDSLSSLDQGASARDRRLHLETSLAAHEALSGLCPENVGKFKDVLAFLREDMERAGAADGAPGQAGSD
jgi:anti-sigma B factor antagonist